MSVLHEFCEKIGRENYIDPHVLISKIVKDPDIQKDEIDYELIESFSFKSNASVEEK